MANYQSIYTGQQIDNGITAGLNALRYDEDQNLTDAQKEKAQENLGLGGAVRFDTEQTHTDAERSQAQANIINTYCNDIEQVVKITALNTTLGSIATTLAAGKHVLFDVSSLGTPVKNCSISIDTVNNVYRVFDIDGRYAEGTYTSSVLLTMALAQASNVATQQQIDHLQNEIDELGGKSAIENWGALAQMVKAGTSQNIISAGDQIDVNWIKTVLGTTANGLTVTCSDIGAFADEIGEAENATYIFVYDGTHWNYNGENVDIADYAISVGGTPVAGEVMTIVTTIDVVPFTFVSYDTAMPDSNEITHNWLLEQTYAPATKAYDTYESVLCLAVGKTLTAGKYYIPMYSWRSNKTFNVCFTLTADVGNSGSKVQFASGGYNSGTIKDNNGNDVASVYYPKNFSPVLYGTTTSAGSVITPSFLSDVEIASDGGYTKLEASDDIVLGDFDECSFGNNAWVQSNIRKWLNDDSKNGNWSPTHDNDIASAYNRTSGFLYGLDPRVKAIMQECSVDWTAGRGKDGYTYNTTYQSTDKVFLLSMKEMGFKTINTAEGAITDYYKEVCGGEATDEAKIGRAKYNQAGGTLNNYRWSRSAYVSNSGVARSVTATGAHNDIGANHALYFAPAFIIG